MNTRGFCRAGHLPTLVAAFLYFDISFMVWVLLGPLAPFLGEDLKLNAAEKGLLVAIPLLGGSLFRPLLGMLTERIGGRRSGLLGLFYKRGCQETNFPLWASDGSGQPAPSRTSEHPCR